MAGWWTRRRFLAAAAAVPAVAACSSGSGGPTAGAGGPVTVPYGDDREQVADLWLPDGPGPHPVVALVHGGFWRAQYDRSLMRDLAADLAARGRAAWNIEYRRVGQAGGAWPGTFADVAAAVDALAGVADEHALDLDAVVAAGHSAGGHLALWLATRPGLPADAPGAAPTVVVAGAVSQAGVADLRRAAERGTGGRAVPDLLGPDPRYDLCSPIERLPLGVPSLCVHGQRDDIVPIEQSERFVAAAVAAGDDAELAPFRGGHFEVLDPTHESWTATLAWLDAR